MPALTLTLTRWPGARAIPAGLASAFARAGFAVGAAPADLELRWAGGVEAVALDGDVDHAVIIAGDDPPVAQGEQARAHGALGYVTPDTAQAVAPLAHAALLRARSGEASHALVHLSRPLLADRSDTGALADLIERVARTLQADAVRAALREDGHAPLVRWGDAPAWLTALPARAGRVVVPDAAHSPITPAGATGAAVALTLAEGADGPGLQVAFAWQAPRLLAPVELALLDLLRLKAVPTLAPRRAASAARAELDVTRRLVAEMRDDSSRREAARQVLAAFGHRAGVSAAVFLGLDPEPIPRVHLLAVWARRSAVEAMVLTRLAGLQYPVGPLDALASRVDARLSGQGLAVQRTLGLGEDTAGWILLLDAPGEATPRALSPALCRFAAALLERRAQQQAAAVLDPHEGALADSPEPVDVLVWAARGLREATEACVALVYVPDGDGLTLRRVVPARTVAAGALRHPVQPGSLTAEAIAARAPRRVLDVADPTDPQGAHLARDHLSALAATVGIAQVRSWLVVPLVDEADRLVGALKLLTSERGPFLTLHEARLGVEVARRATLALTRVARRARLDALNRIGERIAARDGQALADSMVAHLQRWFATYAPPGGALLLAVRSTIPVTGETVAVARASSPTVADDVTRGLVDHSMARVAEAEASWHEHTLRGQVGAHHFAGVPIHLPGDDGLQGHLFLLRPAAVDAVALRALTEAGREMSVILHHERFRVAWKLVIGRFRHALLGPVQGLQSAGLALADEARQPDADPAEMARLAQMISEESAAIHRWREYERLFDEVRPRVRLRRQALRVVVDRCAQRFQPRFEARTAGFTVEWQVPGPAYLRFDDTALDLVLSNLLDNAAKYVFGSRHGWLRVYGTRSGVRIEVGDIGHRLPDDTDIYRTGERLTWEDPFRVIAGQGIGLPLARALVEAHGGRLSHRCEPAGGSDKTDPATRPYRVVFTVDLPRGGDGPEESR